MTETVSDKPEPLTRWLVEEAPKFGCVCIHIGDIGWARLQQRELVGFQKQADRLAYQYSAWTDIVVELPPALSSPQVIFKLG